MSAYNKDFPKDEIYERFVSSKVWSGNWKYFLSDDQFDLVDQLKEQATIPVEVGQVGSSQYNLPIHSMRFGNPEGRKVLIWARQHGDEPECTAALNMSLYELLSHSDAVPIYKKILEELDILVVPMVNPGGTDMFTRESVVGIDLNRDAAAQVTPEASVLIKLKDTFNPEFAFNMHDMNPRKHSEDDNPELVTLAFQAGPFDEHNRDNDVRSKAKTIIGKMIDTVQDRCLHIAKYKANYMNRAFGDSMMRWGVSCILIESGSLPDTAGGDDEVIRLHALSLMSGLYHIAIDEDKPYNADYYQELPLDAGTFEFDEALRGGEVVDVESSLSFKGDVGIQKHVLDNHVSQDRQFRSSIGQVGDLNHEYAAQDYDATGCYLMPGAFAFVPSTNFKDIHPTNDEVRPYLEAGITAIATSYGPFTSDEQASNFLDHVIRKPTPINMVVFEKVQNLSTILSRFGASEFRGFCLEDAVVDMGTLNSILAEKAGVNRQRIPGLSQVHKISIYLVSSSAPSKRHLHICVAEEESELTSSLSADDLNDFLSRIKLTESQVTFSIHPKIRDENNLSIPANYLMRDDEIKADFLSAQVSGANSKSEVFDFFRQVTSDSSKSLKVVFGGHIRIGAMADVVAYPYEKGDWHIAAPRFVFLNGECVVNNAENRYIPRLGRWFIST